jgi:hypothetical protein
MGSNNGGPTKGTDKLGTAPDRQPGSLGAELRKVVFRLGYLLNRLNGSPR